MRYDRSVGVIRGAKEIIGESYRSDRNDRRVIGLIGGVKGVIGE